MSHIDFLLDRLKETGESDALAMQEDVISGDRLYEEVTKANTSLVEKGVKRGDVVVLHGDFSINSIAYLLALINLSTIVVPLTAKTKVNVDEQLHELDPDFLIDTYSNVSIIEYDFGADKHAYIKQLIHTGKPGIILYTSGSSGKPKAVVHDFSKLLKKFEHRRPSLRTLNFLLFDHWGGLNTLLHSLSNNSMLVLPDVDRSPDKICHLIEKYKIELLPATPSFLNILALSGALSRYDLSSIRVISYGAEPMPESTLQNLVKYFPEVDFRQTYGMIELGVLRAKSKSNDSLWVKLGGEGYNLRVLDGILQIKSESSMLGYIDAETPITEDGYFITGDMAEQDGEYFKILGRKSDIINVGGQKVYPSEVETVLLQIDGVDDASVVGEPNPLLGNIIVARILPAEGVDENELIRKIKRECAQKLQSFMVPTRVKISKDALQNHRLKRQR
ncbi:MAG: fatty acid--CoA ligase family protein [Lentilitoribacter sp.]